MTTFTNKVILITGSSQGIGFALAKQLAAKGASIVLNGRDEAKLQKAKLEIEKLNGKCIAVCADIATEQGCTSLLNATMHTYGKLDILICNAGVSMRGSFGALSSNVITQVFAVNTIAALLLSNKAIAEIKKNKGSIVYISSQVAFRGLPYISIYAASKMALTAIAQSIWIENDNKDLHAGIYYVGYTQNEEGKTFIDASGNLVPIKPRKGRIANTPQAVAEKIIIAISKRKQKIIIGKFGTLYYLLQKYFPRLITRLFHYLFKRNKFGMD